MSPIRTIRPTAVGTACPFAAVDDTYHLILTVETHNFPCGVAPFPGAETGTGGRLRDVQATGRGAMVVAGISAYCMGSLNIPGYSLPWEDATCAAAAASRSHDRWAAASGLQPLGYGH